jgi:hypothetical protein
MLSAVHVGLGGLGLRSPLFLPCPWNRGPPSRFPSAFSVEPRVHFHRRDSHLLGVEVKSMSTAPIFAVFRTRIACLRESRLLRIGQQVFRFAAGAGDLSRKLVLDKRRCIGMSNA